MKLIASFQSFGGLWEVLRILGGGGGVRGSLGVYGGLWGVLEKGCLRALEGFEGFWGFLRVFGGF